MKFSVWNNRIILLHHNSFQSMWIMYHYIVDWEEFNLISKYVKPGDHFFDIGANMGLYSVWASQFITNGKIHSFEPDSENYKRLEKSIDLNQLQSQVNINKSAVSDLDGEIAFSKDLDIMNHIVSINDNNIEIVQSLQIDTYIKQHDILNIAYMKIDVEGFEYAVLKGAHSALCNKKIEIIQLEINTSISNSGKSIKDMLNLLTEYHYGLCCYDVKNNQLISTVYSELRENYFAVSDLEKINLKLKGQIN